MRRALVVASVALAACAGGGVAQEARGGTLGALEGKWTADCAGFAPGASCSLAWSEGLHGDLMRVSYEVTDADGARLFAGEGVYRGGGDAFAGFWTDTNGSLHPLEARFADGVLTTLWGRPETEEGRTRYALDGAGGLAVTDWMKAEGEWRQFMHADYRREG